MKKPTIECITQDDGTDAIEARNSNSEHMYLQDVADAYNEMIDALTETYKCIDHDEFTWLAVFIKKALTKAGVTDL